MKIALGIDIGGTNTKMAVVDQDGVVQAFESFKTLGSSDFDIYIKTIRKYHDLLLKNYDGVQTIQGIGVGCPDINSLTGVIEHAPNLPWHGINLRQALANEFKCQVQVENDATAAAIGSKLWGAGQKFNDFVFLTLGTGVGTGIFVGGKILKGIKGMGGEGGHSLIIPHGRRCPCGEKGHLEAYLGAQGIITTAKEEFAVKMDLKDMAISANEGNEEMRKIFYRTADYLAIGLINFINILGPEAIIIGGGVARLGTWFSEDLKKKTLSRVMPFFKDHTEIILSQMDKTQGAVMGAAAQILRHHI